MHGLRVHRRECLQTGLWKQPGRSFSGRGPVLLRGPKGQRQNPARPLALASLAQTFLASSGTATRSDRLPGDMQICPGPIKAQPAKVFPLGLGLS